MITISPVDAEFCVQEAVQCFALLLSLRALQIRSAFVTNALHQFRQQSDFSLEGEIVSRIRFSLIPPCTP